MVEKIFEFFARYVQLTEAEKAIIAEHSTFQFFPAGHELLRAGQYAKNCYFVVEGMLRSYRIQDGEEKITEFHTEFSAVNPASYINGEPSTYYISCVEDSILSTSDKDRSGDFFERLPRLRDAALQMLTDVTVRQQLTYADFKHLNPDERYAKLLATRPDLVNRVPQYMIASYLGIQPPSLSRIRKRMRDQKL